MTSLSFGSKENNKASTRTQHKTLRHGSYARRWFHRAAGHVSLLADAAARAGRRWFHGVARCRQAFA